MHFAALATLAGAARKPGGVAAGVPKIKNGPVDVLTGRLYATVEGLGPLAVPYECGVFLQPRAAGEAVVRIADVIYHKIRFI